MTCCAFSHRVLWRAVGILCCCAFDLRGLRSRSSLPVSNIARLTFYSCASPTYAVYSLPGPISHIDHIKCLSSGRIRQHSLLIANNSDL